MAEGPAPTSRPITKIRHWKEQFDPNGSFVWRRPTKIQGGMTRIGDPLDAALVKALGPARLKRLWKVGMIADANFEAPNVATGRVTESESGPEPVKVTSGPQNEIPEGVTVEGAGGWYTVTDGDSSARVRGKEQLEQLLQTIRETRAAQAEADAKAAAEADAEAKTAVQNDEGGSAPGNGEE